MMDEQRRRKMAGPFVPLPGEIFNLLEDESPECFRAYAYMQHLFFVEQDPEVEGEWVLGRIQATRAQIGRRLGRERSWFKEGIWPRLEELGLVRETEEGFVELPKLYKKAHQYLNPEQVNKQFNFVFRRLQELESKIDGEPPGSEGKPRETEVHPRETEVHPRETEVHPRASTADILLKGSELLDHEEEEEEGNRVSAKSQKKQHEPGSREWIIEQIVNLFPARGYVPHKDDSYIEQIEKFSAAAQIEAFKAARSEGIWKQGNLDWIINRLRHPEVFVNGEQDTDDSRGSGKDKRRHKGGRKAGKGRVGRERWPDVE